MILKPIRYLIWAQERRRYTVLILFFFSLFTGIVRAFEEILFFRISLKNSEIITFVAFYFSLGWYLTAALSWVSKVHWQKVNLAVVIGIFLGVFPPIFDLLLSGRNNIFYGYYYLWNLDELPWLGYNPSFNYPAGEAITIWLSIAFCGIYVALKTSSWWRTLLALGSAYLIFLLHGSFLPMLVTYLRVGVIPNVAALKSLDSVLLLPLVYHIAMWHTIAALLIYFFIRRALTKHLLKRILHTLPFVMVSLIASALVKADFQNAFLVALFTFLAAVGTLIQNDWFDRHEDKYKSPVEKDDVTAFNIFFFLAAAFLFMLNFRAITIILLAYFTSFLYNYPFYRARNSFPGNLKIEGVWGGSSYLAGLLLNATTTLENWQLLSIFLVFGGFSLVAILKDAKDVEQDSQNRVTTVYTLFHRKGIAIKKIHFYIRLCLFAVFTVPCIWLFFLQGYLVSFLAFLLGPVMIFTTSQKLDAKHFQFSLAIISLFLFYIYFVLLIGNN